MIAHIRSPVLALDDALHVTIGCGFRFDGTNDAERAAPGKPEMNVVLKARPGICDLSFSNRSTVCVRAGRFIPRSTRFDMCCSGMSMYLHTCTVLA